MAKNENNCGTHIWFKKKSTYLSKRAIENISGSWRHGTKKRHNSFLKEFIEFCAKRNEDVIQATVEIGIKFLTEYYNTGVGKTSVNYTQSSSLLIMSLLEG